MNLNAATFIEPYLESDGKVGFVIGNGDGYVEHLSCEEWNNKLNKDETKILTELMVKSTKWWALPNKPPIEEYRKKLTPPNILIGPDRRSWTEGEADKILTGIHARIVAYLKAYVSLDEDRYFDLIANFVIASYFKDQFSFSPLVIIDSVSGSGKTTILEAVSQIAYRGYRVTSYSGSSMALLIDMYQLTLLMDEGSLGYSCKARKDDLHDMFINMCDMRGTRVRVNNDRTDLDCRTVYSSAMLATRGVVFDDDVVNRSIIVNLGSPDPKMGRYSPLEGNYPFKDPLCRPETIRTDLMALRLLTESRKNVESCANETAGIWFRYRIDETCRKLAGNPTILTPLRARYKMLPPSINGRLLDIAKMYYTLGTMTGTEEQMLMVLVDNYTKVRSINDDSTDSMMFNAFLNVIRVRFDLMSKSGIDPATLLIPRDSDIRMVCEEITTKAIIEEYRSMRKANGQESTESSQSLTSRFKSTGIKIRKGSHNFSYIDTSDPAFLKKLRDGVEAFGYEDNKEFFSRGVLP